jgi:3,4-dihydroxy 2-butanone 4-phosphate synthase/GTP cyclohydrolase II
VDGGVLMRAGHTEAGCDLAAMAGCSPTSVICEIMKDDGTMARLPDLMQFAAEHGLKIGTIADLIEYRSRTESLVQRVSEREVETVQGRFRLVVYSDLIGNATHLALVKGEIRPDREALVRVHEPLSVIDLLDVQSASHSWNFNRALAAVGWPEWARDNMRLVRIKVHSRPCSMERKARQALSYTLWRDGSPAPCR